MSVYIANFGLENYEWPRCFKRNAVATMNETAPYKFWAAGDREGYINYRIQNNKTASGITPTRQVASRWFNLMTVVAETENDLWIHKAGDDLWWTKSTGSGPSFEPGKNPAGVGVVTCFKPCEPWSNKNMRGQRLTWRALHPKAVDFLSTEATLQTLSQDYAKYASALIAGEDLSHWHSLRNWKAKASAALRGQAGTIFNGVQRSAAAMADQAFGTAATSNGQQALRTIKNKDVLFRDKFELERYILDLLSIQDGLCAITAIRLQHHGEEEDQELLCSLDRIDSSGHYEAGNLQVVCRFINRWKGAGLDSEIRRMIDLIKTTSSDATIQE